MSSRTRRSDGFLLRKVKAVVRGHGKSGATSQIVHQSLPRRGGKYRYSESDVKRVLSENSSKWFGHGSFLRTESVTSGGVSQVCYVSQEFVDGAKVSGLCYVSGTAKYPYQVLASRFAHTKRAFHFLEVMPLVVGETVLRRMISGKKNVLRTGVIVIALGSKKPNTTTKKKGATVVTSEKKVNVSEPKSGKARASQAVREKNGWLHKRGGNIFRKSWHPRYVRLRDSVLTYYMSDLRSERKRGSYTIDRDTSVQHAVKESSTAYPNTFRVKGRRFDLLFAAKSALEEQNWIDCIRNAVKSTRGKG